MNHTVIINKRPTRTGKHSTPDGAICGNGDVSVILGEHENGIALYVGKSDFWYASETQGHNGGIKPVGILKIDVPPELYNNYCAEQRMDEGEIYCRFSDGEKSVEVLTFVSHNGNDIWTETTCSNGVKTKQPVFVPSKPEFAVSEEKTVDNIKLYSMEFNEEDLIFKTKLDIAFNEASVGNKTICVLSLASGFDGEPLKSKPTTEEEFDKERTDNRNWWVDFYGKSSFVVADEVLEMNWYASQYLLAVCSLNRDFPPGLYGNFITKDSVNWSGDYHLNYNYQGSFYAACSSNHTELTDCYAAPILDLRERGRKFSEAFLGEGGVFYPVGIGPKGMLTERSDAVWEKMFLGQRSNAVHATDIMVMRWYATYDREYAKEVYPYFLDVADFWEGYLVKRDGVYNVVHDAVHEIPYYKDDFDPKKYKKQINEENNLLTLGLLRMFFKCMVDMSAELDIDGERRTEWKKIAENLHEFPTFIKKGRRVFRYTTNGTAWNNTNTLCIQHIYPCGQIGLSSDGKTRKIAKNTFLANRRWYDGNGGCSYYPCAARLGISPKLIIKKFKNYIKKFQLPNMLFLQGGGCLENSSIAATTLNEMVMQSFEGMIRVFPNWDTDIDCAFENLRADGAFLVSSSVKNGNIGKIKILSEKGRTVRFSNPFERAKITTGSNSFFSVETIITLDTSENETIVIEKG